MKNLKINKKVYFISLSFLLAFFIFCSSVLFIASVITTPKFCKAVLEKSSYKDLAYEEIEKELSSVAIPGGLPEDFFNYGITKKSLDDNLFPFIDTVYQNKVYTGDSSAIYTEIESKLFQYADENSPGYSEETALHLKEMAQICADKYMSYANPKVLKILGNFVGKFSFPALIAALVVLGFAVICGIVMLSMKAKKEYFIYSFSASALLLGVIPAIVLLFGGMERLSILVKSLKAFIDIFISTPLYMMLICAAILLIVTFVTALIKPKKN